ncbi:hypothetical protein TNIN_111011 [Trichonephila inaurata madagascariensis]|uniref:Uncharacterized protein n=1 Tax=Trichonephila inaurata madagascariensis TaxID=2747483 RepID=A0A8X6XBS5_9ARAC|nr:hypothetical protein TNIN_111011 [Trichonephila inaurata madagascariensis]
MPLNPVRDFPALSTVRKWDSAVFSIPPPSLLNSTEKSFFFLTPNSSLILLSTTFFGPLNPSKKSSPLPKRRVEEIRGLFEPCTAKCLPMGIAKRFSLADNYRIIWRRRIGLFALG